MKIIFVNASYIMLTRKQGKLAVDILLSPIITELVKLTDTDIMPDLYIMIGGGGATSLYPE